MITNIGIACFLTLVFANPISAQITISSTFGTDAEGWIGIPGEGSVSYSATGGNPGGHIRVTDIGVGGGLGSGAIAPSQFLGDLSAFDGGLLSYDMATFAGGGSTFGIFGTVQITGSGMSASFDVAVTGPPFGVWQSFSAPLAAASWGVSEVEWASILSDVTEIAFSTDAFDGPETIGVDNFTLASTPLQVQASTWGRVKAERR
jgi:hypothetical protein